MNALIGIQQELKAPKGQMNKFGGYRYRSCEDILEAVKPLLNKYNVYLTIADEIHEVGGRVYIKAIATLYSGEGVKIAETSAYAREPETKKGFDEAQITGAASSYARKYALNGLFAIDDTKDADTMDNREPAQKAQEKPEQEKPFDINKARSEFIALLEVKGIKNDNYLADFEKASVAGKRALYAQVAKMQNGG